MKVMFAIAMAISSVANSGLGADQNQFKRDYSNVSVVEREHLALKQALAGTIPQSNFELVPVTVTKGKNTLTFYVTPNYFTLGSDNKEVIMPFNFHSATKIAKRYQAILPTTKMVDLIYNAADIKLKPSTMKPGPRMASTSYILKHQKKIDKSLPQNYRGLLLAGHKKDTVLSNVLHKAKDRIAIYGWHRDSQSPIQPLSTWHWASYADYSHGIRLVDRTVVVNGKNWDIADVLNHHKLSQMLSYEGTVDVDALMSPETEKQRLVSNR